MPATNGDGDGRKRTTAKNGRTPDAPRVAVPLKQTPTASDANPPANDKKGPEAKRV